MGKSTQQQFIQITDSSVYADIKTQTY